MPAQSPSAATVCAAAAQPPISIAVGDKKSLSAIIKVKRSRSMVDAL